MGRVARRSTITVRGPRRPLPVLMIRSGERSAFGLAAWAWAAWSTCGRTSSGDRPIRPAAISTCCSTSSARSWAAATASETVGGSLRTRMGGKLRGLSVGFFTVRLIIMG